MAADSSKKARHFDIDEMIVIAKHTAQERYKENLEKQLDAVELLDSAVCSATVSGAEDSIDEEDVIGPPIPSSFTGISESSILKDSDGEDEDEGNAESDEDLDTLIESVIPLSHEVTFEHGNKPISAIGCDRNGARWATGGYDYDIKLWDFGGMNSDLKSFRTLRPFECHVIKSISFSCTGDSILIAAGNCQPKVLDRDGKEIVECVKGDMYLKDKVSTKGHTHTVNCAQFSPKAKNEFLTCSDDGTVRLWNVETAKKKHLSIIKTKSKQGTRTTPTFCAYSRDSKYIAAGCNDGSIQLWQHGKNYVNTSLLCREAHSNAVDISCLSFSYDNNYLLSRSLDDTMKLWDLRKFSKPVNVRTDLDTYFSTTECTFSPRDEFCVTGTYARKNGGTGRLVFLEKNSFSVVKEIEYPNTSVLRLVWHPRINQLFVTLSDGTVKLYYDQSMNKSGVLLCVKKPVKRIKEADSLAEQLIIAPAALPPRKIGFDGYVKESYTLKQMLRHIRLQQRPAHMRPQIPEKPLQGHGQGGRVGAPGGSLHAYVARQIGLSRKMHDETEDPRQAILKHAKDAEENPYWIAPAYKKSQPKSVLAKRVEDEVVDTELRPVFKKPKSD